MRLTRTVRANSATVRISNNGKCWACFDVVQPLIVGLAFVASAIPHLGNPYYFLATVFDHGIRSPRLSLTIAAVLPYLMLAIGISLCVRRCYIGAQLLAFLLLGAFVVLRFAEPADPQLPDCGCFGARSELPQPLRLLGNLWLLWALSCTWLVGLFVAAMSSTSAPPNGSATTV